MKTEGTAIGRLIADAQKRIAAERNAGIRAYFEAELAAYTYARDVVAAEGLTLAARRKIAADWYRESRKRDRQDLSDHERSVAGFYSEAGVRAELALFGDTL